MKPPSSSPAVIPALRLPARQALRINFSERLKAGISLSFETREKAGRIQLSLE
jgi:hypothetical protein